MNLSLFAVIIVRSNLSSFSFIQRNPKIIDINRSLSLLISNWLNTILSNRSNSYIFIKDLQMVKFNIKWRISWTIKTFLIYLPKSSYTFETLLTDRLFFSSPGIKICDQWYLVSFPALKSFIKPTFILHLTIEPLIGSLGFINSCRWYIKIGL